MLRAIAIDDEPLPLEILKEYCSQSGFVSLEKTFTKIGDAQKYIQSFPVDLLFLDIQMPKISGIEFYKSLEQNMMLIFTTAHSQYAIDAFNLNAVDYLLKPFSYERFLLAVNKARDYFNYLKKSESADNKFLYVRSDYSLIQIAFSDILYIESFADYLSIRLTGNKKVITRMPLKTVMEKLPQHEFIRVHRSFVIPFSRIQKVRKKTIYLSEKEIPVGSSYEQEFFSRYKAD